MQRLSDTPSSVHILAPGQRLDVICARGDRILVRRGCVKVAQHVRRPRLLTWQLVPWMEAFVVLKAGAYVIACGDGVTGAANVVVTRRGDVMASLVEATK